MLRCYRIPSLDRNVMGRSGREGFASEGAGCRGLRRWYQNLVAEVAEEALEDRRNRIYPRVVKRKMSN